MNKNTTKPLLILVAIVAAGGYFLFSGNERSSASLDTGSQTSNGNSVAAASDLRTLELSVPGMFCAGCTASVEGYVSSVPGVERVQARLTPTKSATVIYDSNMVTKEDIIANPVFELYDVDIISDNAFDGSALPTTVGGNDGAPIPEDLQTRSQQAVKLIQQKSAEGKDVSAAKNLFNQVNSNLERGNITNAQILIGTVINLLEQL